MTKAVDQFFSPSRITEDLSNRLKTLAVPGVDVEAVMATQRKNIEALANASRSALDGAHAVGKRQAEILQATMTETAHSLKSLAKAGSPLDMAAKQADLMKEGFEKALRNMRELAEMVAKAQAAAVDAISDRVVQSLSELKDVAAKPTDTAGTEASAQAGGGLSQPLVDPRPTTDLVEAAAAKGGRFRFRRSAIGLTSADERRLPFAACAGAVERRDDVVSPPHLTPRPSSTATQ